MTAEAFTLATGGAALVLPSTSWVAAPFAPPLPAAPPPAPPAGPTLAAAISALLLAKTAANRRPKSISNLRQYLRAFARGRESIPVASITHSEIEAWLDRVHRAPGGRATGLNRLSALCSHAVRRGWLPANPCARIERVSLEASVPKILNVAECQKLLEIVRQREPRTLAWVCLGLFAGLRPSEADATEWPSINFSEGTITIDAAASKIRRRRIVRLMPAAIAWLEFAKAHGFGALNVCHATRRRAIRRTAEAMGWRGWPHDILRHTAASHWIAQIQDAGKVAFHLGNSPGVLARHYVDLVNREDAARFWALRPPTA